MMSAIKDKTVKVDSKKVELKEVEKKAISLLNELKDAVNLNGIKNLQLVLTKASYVSWKYGNRIIFGIRYNLHNRFIPIVAVTKDEFKQFESLGGYYGSNRWYAEFRNFNPEKDDIKKFAAITEVALERYKKAKEPKAAKPAKINTTGMTATEAKLAKAGIIVKNIKKHI